MTKEEQNIKLNKVDDKTAYENLLVKYAELKADNDARKFAMAMSEKVEKQLREQIEKMKCCYNCSKWNDGECEESPKSKTFFCADFKCDKWECIE